ncbi:MAG: hypothetical protein ABIP07_03485 [Sphingomicrobium sp.]
MARWIASSVWALIENGTSWTVDARLVAVTMIRSPSISSPALAAWATSSWVDWARAGVAKAKAAVPTSRIEARMIFSPKQSRNCQNYAGFAFLRKGASRAFDI